MVFLTISPISLEVNVYFDNAFINNSILKLKGINIQQLIFL